MKTQRDAWAYGPSRRTVADNMKRMIAVYNHEVERFDAAHVELTKKARDGVVDAFVDADPTKIAWTRALKSELVKGTRLVFDAARLVPSLYRPFAKEWLYFDRKLNELVLQNPRFFPSVGAENRVIGVSAGESRSGYSVLMADVVPSLHATDMVGSQYFPLYLYDGAGAERDDRTEVAASLFATPKNASTGGTRRDGITDAGLAHFQATYPGEGITKDDVFYYVYGILHSPDYRERYADNLGKELPRIPRVKTAADFWAFSNAGRALGELHVGYETVSEFPGTIDGPAKPTAAQYRVEKMKFGKGKDKTTVHYNNFITVRDIPLEAYEYVVNGKPAIEWVMERQSVTTDKASGIVKDANAWATETVGDPRYPLSLLLRVITVSLETMKIVRALPKLDILDEAAPAEGAADGAKVLPFRRVTPKPDERFTTCVPLVPLHAAAGGFSEAQEDLPELDDPAAAWITWDGAPRFAEGMFVAQVVGRSMDPVIPDGAYCLFRRASLPSSPERPVLVRHGGTADPETGGQYTVKHYHEETGPGGARRIVLHPTNPTFKPLVVTPAETAEVRVIAEVTQVLES